MSRASTPGQYDEREEEAALFRSCSSFPRRRGVDGRDKRGHDAGTHLLVNPNSEPCWTTRARHCEEAKPTKQSTAAIAALDCFASLAMTA
jgi:hypothetical protein